MKGSEIDYGLEVMFWVFGLMVTGLAVFLGVWIAFDHHPAWPLPLIFFTFHAICWRQYDKALKRFFK